MSDSDGKLIIVSGPSGAGKTSVLRQVLQRMGERLVVSVSATTRPPRQGEVDGEDYHFLSPQEFQQKRAAGKFLECFEVFGRGYWYGTLKSEVEPRVARGEWVLLEIDVDGAMSVLEQYPQAVTIFIRPRSLEQLETQLRGRRTETEDALQRRLEVARHELNFADKYTYNVINEDIQQAVRATCEILESLGEVAHDS
ncbi:MAG: guanylate kinase [Pirellulales bacterium]